MVNFKSVFGEKDLQRGWTGDCRNKSGKHKSARSEIALTGGIVVADVKKDSIKRYLLIGGIGGSVLLLLLLLCFGGYIILQYRHVYKRDHEIMTSDYAQQLAQDISSMEAYIKNLYGNNVHYQILKRSQITESQWMLASYYLNNNFSSRADNLDYFGGIFYYDKAWDSLHSEFSGFTFTGDSYRLNQAIKQEARAHMDEKMPYKEIMTYEGEAYLLYILGDRGKLLGYTVNLSQYFVLRENMQLVISDGEGNILVNQGDMLLEEEAIAQKLRSNTERAGLMYMISRKDLEGENLRILLVHKDEKLAFWNQMEFWRYSFNSADSFCCPLECIPVCKADYLSANRSLCAPPYRNEKRRAS